MALYFLDVIDNDQRIDDPDGQEFDSVGDALAEARMAARESIANDLRENRPVGFHRRIEVRNDLGEVVARLTFEQAALS